MDTHTHVVIMAGGVGSRFWPMSTPEHPKQFMDVLGCGKSLIQLTVDRFLGICPAEHIWIVTSEKYQDIVREQLPAIPTEQILLEPVARNTAPCIAYACWKIKKRHPDVRVVVTPADAMVVDVACFRQVIRQALDFIENRDAIVTIGIHPCRPDTGYGYISAETTGEQVENEVLKVKEFKEKPDLETARHYLAAGNYYWNAGIFVWNAATIEKALRQYVPQIAAVFDQLDAAFYTKEEPEAVSQLFPTCERISIDYAVMEKADNVYVVPADFGWSDLGSWGALHALLPKDEKENVLIGKTHQLHECQRNIVHVSGLKKVVLQGLDGYIVAEKDNVLLVCKLSEEQRIKDFAQD